MHLTVQFSPHLHSCLCIIYLLEQVVAEVGHELRRRGPRDVLVAEALERLLERFVEQARVGEARVDIGDVLVVKLDHRPDVLLFI